MRRFVLLFLVIAAGCTGGDSPGVSVDDAWARPVPPTAPNAAFFATLINSSETDETLVSASSDACRVIELHESAMTDGVMSMQQVAGGILVPASQSVLLQPGGLHVMCIDKTMDFIEGEGIELTLTFSGGGGDHDETVTATVEDR